MFIFLKLCVLSLVIVLLDDIEMDVVMFVDLRDLDVIGDIWDDIVYYSFFLLVLREKWKWLLKFFLLFWEFLIRIKLDNLRYLGYYMYIVIIDYVLLIDIFSEIWFVDVI